MINQLLRKQKQIRLFDLSGKLISQAVDQNLGEASAVKSINMSSLSNGIYMVNVSVGDKTISEKIKR